MQCRQLINLEATSRIMAMPRIEPWATGCEAQTQPVCYVPPFNLTENIFSQTEMYQDRLALDAAPG